MAQLYKCPICEADWGEMNPINSFEMCKCGIQFGYTDASPTEEGRAHIHEIWRKIWLANGKQKVTDEMLKESDEWMNRDK